MQTQTPGSLRRSNGLREFFSHLAGSTGLRVLDLGAPSQANVNFITGLGHRIYQDDLLRDVSRQDFTPAGFLERTLDYPAGLFDGVLCWDLFDVLPDPTLAQPIADRLAEITRTGGGLLMFFHTAEPATAVTAFRSQISGPDALDLTARGSYKLKRPYNNRNIENLFRGFHGLKFFLAKDGLREVLVVR
jgi:hypothetical protein